MFSSDEHSGYSVFVIGLVILVFAGIVLSIAVERRFSFSSAVSTLEAEIRKNEPELERLRASHRESSWRWLQLEPDRTAAKAALASLEKEAADLERHQTTLVAERESLRTSTRLLEEEFKRYRMKCREAARDAAIGESLGKLATLDGREYREVFISRVTGVGLEIRHADGTARLSAADLDPSFQERFQWDDEERKGRLDEEKEDVKVQERIPETTKTPERPRPKPDEARSDPRKVQMLRGKMIAWRSKVSQLRSEKSKALSSSYGSQASPPGSLETWQAKAARLDREIARAEAELAAAKAALASISPGDESLRPGSGGR